MARTKLVDGVRVNLSAEEEEQRDQDEAAWTAGAFDRAISALRQDRGHKLAATDWFALQDVTLSDDMRNYRQALRDLPDGLISVTDIEAVDWPVNPE